VASYCERTVKPKPSFDRRSFRWKQSGSARVLIACPKGHYDARREVCRVGTRAYKVVAPARGRCPVGQRRVHKA